MPKNGKHFGPPPIDKIWLKEQFDKLHSEHALILKKIGDLGKIDQLNPELAAGLIQTAKLVRGVDEKVPDKTVPPGSGPPPGSHWGPAPTKNFPQTKPPTSNERTSQ